MLSDWLMWVWVTIMIFAVTLGGMVMQAAGYQMGVVQQEAQEVAIYEGQYGGYDINAANSIERFTQQENLSSGQVKVNVSPPGAPVPYGTEVTAHLSVPFKFQLGTWITPFTVNLTGSGRSVSVYTPGVTPDTTYETPI